MDIYGKRYKMGMIHIKEYASFTDFSRSVPVYNEEEYMKSPSGAKPVMKVSTKDVVSTIQDLLDQKDAGEISLVLVNAEIPKQGKNAPSYLKDIEDEERFRMAKRQAGMPQGRIGRGEEGEEEYLDSINIFVDVEYVVTGTGNEQGQEVIYAIGRSLLQKTQRNPSLGDYYTIAIPPARVEEISFHPSR